jgi:predicted adenylyl cyclase CyaB
MGQPRRNLELKARDDDPGGSLRTCEDLGAEDKGLLLQVDTYFDVPRGRLKLRRERGAVPHLIAYERPDRLGQKESRYRIAEVENADEVEEALGGILGVAVVVTKARRLFRLEDVRIHLDSVDGLGSFIEFEGVAASQDVDLAGFECVLTDLRRSFGIGDADLVAGSYRDLVLSAKSP